MELEKITDYDLGKPKRWYRDACGTALAMDLVGERWSLLIIRELLLGPRRFGEVRAALPGISANVLTQRLEGLEKAGMLRRKLLADHPGVQVYELTRWGYAAEEPIFALSRWVAGSPLHDVTLPLSNTAFMLSLRTMMDRGRAAALEGMGLSFRVGGEPFRAVIADAMLSVRRDDAAGAEILFEGDTDGFKPVFYGPEPLAVTVPAGLVRVTGDIDRAQAFVDCFRLPAFIND
ncbi:winged helix-turn-helix transcriptional regulator [Stakelama tenebrarum]|uniref:Helix-turn-helix transcriptional regulator n=1 Tax=Stakelama tenebrarum TaxID=2711215 RepID=A0A6G6Y3Q5_9SPHN|nr:helix-turn-helix domain-containing protein [Sphingosinithalassobacter tenebrarum]QIG79196.1 helix-turn-helix transcriptional regulator [Sphingosinithalassobacter tenebrarum]